MVGMYGMGRERKDGWISAGRKTSIEDCKERPSIPSILAFVINNSVDWPFGVDSRAGRSWRSGGKAKGQLGKGWDNGCSKVKLAFN